MMFSNRKPTFFLFYSTLIGPGGAERLLLKEYKYLKLLGNKCRIVTFEFNKEATFEESIDAEDLIILDGSSILIRIGRLAALMRKNKCQVFLASSGFNEIYIASILSRTKYALHIHHPTTMSFNSTDKYSIFLQSKFRQIVNSNYGAKRLKIIKEKLTIKQIISINIRSFIFLRAIKRSRCNFVLSEYAKREKKDIYRVNSRVACGALEDDIFSYEPKSIGGYDNYKYRILSIARLDINKRIDVLILAFKKFLEKKKNSILLIGGSGPEKGNLSRLVDTLRLKEHVEFIGHIPKNKLFDYYHTADLFVSIDWADYKITAFEALAMGTKVVISNESMLEKNLMNSGYVHVSKPEAGPTCSAMLNTLTNPPAISHSELKGILKNYSWNVYTKNVSEALMGIHSHDFQASC